MEKESQAPENVVQLHAVDVGVSHIEAALPYDLIASVFDILPRIALLQCAKVNKRWNFISAPLIYRSVELVDELEQFPDGIGDDIEFIEKQVLPNARWLHAGSRIRKFAKTLISRPVLAGYIHTLRHSCHEDLPEPLDFGSTKVQKENDSFFTNVVPLLRQAVKFMVNVRTLYIIYGHLLITDVLLDLLLVSSRLERLWIESTNLTGVQAKLALQMKDVSKLNLRSIRIRRSVLWHQLPADVPLAMGDIIEDEDEDGDDDDDDDDEDFSDESGSDVSMDDDSDGEDNAEILGGDLRMGVPIQGPPVLVPLPTVDGVVSIASDFMWPHELSNPPVTTCSILPCLDVSSNLTSLVLDWILPPYHQCTITSILPESLTFPLLTSFQVRHNEIAQRGNAIIKTCLADPVILSFLLRHPNISAFAWPAEWFVSTIFAEEKEWALLKPVVENMSRKLDFLRTEAPLQHMGEIEYGQAAAHSVTAKSRRASRHRAIEFMWKMELLTTLKVEGGFPRDEMYKILEATKRAPLRKVVFISTSWPFKFVKQMPALNMASRIEELKFCGFKDAPLVGDNEWWHEAASNRFKEGEVKNMAVFNDCINSLKSFSNLKYMTLAMNPSVYPFVHLKAELDRKYHGPLGRCENSRQEAGIVDSAQVLSIWDMCIHGRPYDRSVTEYPAHYKRLLGYTPKRLARRILDMFASKLPETFKCMRLLFLMEIPGDGDEYSLEIWNFTIEVEWREGPIQADEEDEEFLELDEDVGDAGASMFEGGKELWDGKMQPNVPIAAEEPVKGRFVITDVIGPRGDKDPLRSEEKLMGRGYF